MEGERLQLRQRTLSEILDGGISLYRAHFTELVKTVSLVIVPVQLVALVVLLAAPDQSVEILLGQDSSTTTLDENGNIESVDVDGGAIAAIFAIGMLGGLAYLLATAAAYRFTSEAALGFEPDWRESNRFALRKLHSVFWVTFLMVLGLIVAFLLLIIPGIWLSVAWALAIPVLLSEGAKGSKALGRSFALVKNNWWKTFGTLAVMYIMVSLLQQGLLVLVSELVVGDDAGTFGAVLVTVVNTALYLIALPFTTAVLTLIYFDLRVRKEGVDLALAAEGIGQAAGATLPEGGGGAKFPPASTQPPPPPPPAPSGS
jgi:hypothetical protein